MTLRLTKAELLRIVKGNADMSPRLRRKPQDARKPSTLGATTPAPRESPGEAALAAALRLHGPDLAPPVRELVFAPPRRFRADFAWPDRRLLVEVDGGTYAPGGGRHAGDKDKDKANLAACLGFRVMRFSPQQIERDPAGCVALIRRALEV